MNREINSTKIFGIIFLFFVISGCAWIGTNRLGKALNMGHKINDVVRLKHVRITNDSGQLLNTDIYLPKGDGSYPTLVMQTPYSKTLLAPWGKTYAERGYNVVMQDSRGRYKSEGDFLPIAGDAEDALPLLKWVQDQEWFNGQMGLLGESYMAIAQWNMADRASLAGIPIKAMTPFMATGSLENFLFQGGTIPLHNFMVWINITGYRNLDFSTFLTMGWSKRHLPLSKYDDTFLVVNKPYVADLLKIPNSDCYRSYLEGEPGRPEFIAAHRGSIENDESISTSSTEGNPPDNQNVSDDCSIGVYGTRWKSLLLKNDQYERISHIPILWIANWYDMFVFAQLKDYQTVVRLNPASKKNHRLIIGPMAHGPYSTLKGDLSRQWSTLKYTFGETLRWYDFHLKGIDNGVDKDPPVSIFVMGKNKWRDEYEWPLARTQYTPYYIHSKGQSNTINGDGTLHIKPPNTNDSPSRFFYDPVDPVPTLGGHNLIYQLGPQDQASIEKRDDVLVFKSDSTAEPIEITGHPEVVLYAASSAIDTDFTAKLVDLHPNGKAINMSHGILRARYRDHPTRPKFMEQGKVYEFHIEMTPISFVLKKGHRFIVEISSSNFPHFARNLNTGEDLGIGDTPVVAEQSVYHNSLHASHIILPIIPTGSGSEGQEIGNANQ